MTPEQRFEAVYRAHYWDVARYVARRLGSTGDAARDLTAEVFVVAWRRRRAVPAEPLPWLYVVARNVVANELRGRSRRARLERRLSAERWPAPATAASHPSPEELHQPVDPDPEERVRSAMERLSPADQEVLRLAAWEQLGTDHLADALSVSRSAAAMRLHRARQRLREVLHSDPDLVHTLRRSR
ncbi:RNA polymerase sigma factor [Thalassiella azotivora]